jgi:hypothetical protein
MASETGKDNPLVYKWVPKFEIEVMLKQKFGYDHSYSRGLVFMMLEYAKRDQLAVVHGKINPFKTQNRAISGN